MICDLILIEGGIWSEVSGESLEAGLKGSLGTIASERQSSEIQIWYYENAIIVIWIETELSKIGVQLKMFVAQGGEDWWVVRNAKRPLTLLSDF